MSETPVITIDGPSGSGKGTVAQRLAHELGWHYLDSGAIYRVLALAALQHQLSLEDEAALSQLAQELDLVFDLTARDLTVWLEGQDVSLAIRSEEAGNAASKVAALPQVRAALLQRQRDFQKAPGLVTDGRDMGTVVFPQASFKVYLTASAEERARRRLKQLKEKGIDSNLSDLTKEIAERDIRDSERTVAPLKPADDALVIDSTALNIQAVLDKVRALVL